MVVTVGLQDISSMYITLKNRFTLYLFIIQELSRLDFVSVDHSNERDIGRH